MEKLKKDYTILYKLQDEILSLVKSLDNDFYLTGGTALHRFYFDFRYSDDLDFFVSNANSINEEFNEIIDILHEKNYTIKIQINARDMKRIFINDILQVDFVNDRVYREGKSNYLDGVRVDNLYNILANKLSALYDREEPKDIFDILSISQNTFFDWKDILKIYDKKATFDKDYLIAKVKFISEHLDIFDSIQKTDSKNIIINKEIILKLLNDMNNEMLNSLN
ncbi:MAG: nucleotidyl transferase AbiEii/AbiGii toxin family protein [Sulfurovum sp.]|jgi:predicted nucleotidyltransferase component of viral defense system|nr:MAG: nucleotidyl transferase AbiEii/AbiGii toxin family protein [Sulfurovum sp.]